LCDLRDTGTLTVGKDGISSMKSSAEVSIRGSSISSSGSGSSTTAGFGSGSAATSGSTRIGGSDLCQSLQCDLLHLSKAS